jgi:PAS domain S-box-containing protein
MDPAEGVNAADVARQLRERDERLRAALTASGTGTFRWDLRTNALDWDDNLDRLFGLRPGEMARSLEHFVALVHPDDRAEVVERCRRCATDGADFDMDFRIIWPDGSVHWLADRGKTYFDDADKPLYMTGACVDITQRKKHEADAAESRRRLEMLYEHAQDAILLADNEARYVDANPAACALLGRTREELLASTVFDVTPVPSVELGRQLWRDFIAAGRQEGEYPLARKDGSCATVEYRAVANIIPGLHLSVLRDVTARKAAEIDRQRFVSLAESSTDFIGMCTPDRKVLFVNPAGRKMVGLETDEEVFASDPLDYFWPDDRARIVNEAIPALQRDGHWSGECRFRHFKTGEPIDTIWNTFVIRDERTGEPVAWATISPDLRAIKAATAAARDATVQRERQARVFDTILSSISDFAYIFDRDGRFIYANKALLDLLGITHEQILGRNFFDLRYPDDLAARLQRQIQQVIDTRQPVTDETPYTSSTGAGGYFEYIFVPVFAADGSVESVAGTTRDITQRRRAAQELAEARDAAEQANAAKDRFLAVLSHELRTPLSPVLMTAVAMETDPDLPDKFREDLAMIRRNIDLETKLIDDLLDLSRVVSGKLKLNLQTVSVHQTLRHVLQICAADLVEKRLNVFPRLEASRDTVSGDGARLQQVFWNLVRNATKFTPTGGDVTVRTVNEPDGRLRVEVIDSGIGIAPELLPRIFDAFEQGDARITRQFGGLGLGLAIAQAVVEMHGGSIAAHSEGSGKGTTFTVRLNTVTTVTSGARPTAPAPAESPAESAPRLLLVDDHEDTANTLARLLTRSGFDVRVATTVAGALQLAADEPFDLVVSDIGLPDGTGYDLMQQVRSRHGLPGIALTGYGMEEDLRRSRDVGFVDHVVKPVNLPHLEQVIRRAIAAT